MNKKPLLERMRTAIAASAVAIGLVLTGCTVGAPQTEQQQSGTTEATTLAIAQQAELCSLNPYSTSCILGVNRQLFQFTGGFFFRIQPDGSLVYDESFGTIEVLSESPLSVKYTIAEGVKWSDGEPVTAADMVLEMVARTGYYNDKSGDQGTAYFSHFINAKGMTLAEFPEVGDDGRSMTITYAQPYSDWSAVNPMSVPAHIVAEKSGVAAGAEELLDLLRGIPAGDPAAPQTPSADLLKVAEVWNSGYDFTSLPQDPDFLVAAGPYMITDWVSGRTITYERNPEYTGDFGSEYDRIVMRIIPDSTAQVQALQNGEVDIIAPTAPTADTVSALEALPNVTMLTGPSSSHELFMLNVREGNVFADKDIREAFFKVVPRELIVDTLVRTIDPEAGVLNSLTFMPGTPGYEGSVSGNGSAEFADVDIEGAKAILAGRTPTIRIGYNRDFASRLDAFLALQANATEAGFVVVDGGLPVDQWGPALRDPGSWDMFMLALTFEPQGNNTTIFQEFPSDGSTNFGGLSNPEIDALVDELSSTVDLEAQLEIRAEIDRIAIGERATVPMYSVPRVNAHSDRVTGVEFSPWFNGIFDLFWKWAPAG